MLSSARSSGRALARAERDGQRRYRVRVELSP